jgi:basic amino acid/polyamine antiporter, APA family
VTHESPSTATPQRLLRRVDAIAIIVGIVIGAGIYKTPSVVAGITGDSGWMFAVWVLGAAISFIGALCYAELATTYPDAGGDYHFLTRAFGRSVGFLYGWARATVIITGAIALLAFVFGDYVSTILSLGAHSTAWWAALIVIALTAINIIGLRVSVRTQNVLTTVEVTGLAAVVLAGLVAPSTAHFDPPPFATSPQADKLGGAMIFVLLTYGGWSEAAYIARELKAGRAIVDALLASLAIIAVGYLGVNAALLNGLGFAELAESKAPAIDLMARAFGQAGANALAVFVAIATLTSINATMIVGARGDYAIGRDWPALEYLGRWNVLRAAPIIAYLLQAGIALLLIAFGAMQFDGFEAMVNFTAPVFWAFLFLVGVALFVLRARDPHAVRPFVVPLYPLTPLVFCASCAFLFYSSVAYAASNDAVHIALWLMLTGVAALAIVRYASKRVVRQRRRS